MKFKKLLQAMAIFAVLLSIMACSTAPYTESFTFTATIEELITKEKFLFDDKYLLVKEENTNDQNDLIYEIPVESFKDYEVGEKVKINVYSNSETDSWDLDHLKFEITVVN